MRCAPLRPAHPPWIFFSVGATPPRPRPDRETGRWPSRAHASRVGAAPHAPGRTGNGAWPSRAHASRVRAQPHAPGRIGNGARPSRAHASPVRAAPHAPGRTGNGAWPSRAHASPVGAAAPRTRPDRDRGAAFEGACFSCAGCAPTHPAGRERGAAFEGACFSCGGCAPRPRPDGHLSWAARVQRTSGGRGGLSPPQEENPGRVGGARAARSACSSGMGVRGATPPAADAQLPSQPSRRAAPRPSPLSGRERAGGWTALRGQVRHRESGVPLTPPSPLGEGAGPPSRVVRCAADLWGAWGAQPPTGRKVRGGWGGQSGAQRVLLRDGGVGGCAPHGRRAPGFGGPSG